MRNFLTIPYQEEIIRKTNQDIVLRGARGCGKTKVTIRWAVENMKQGLDVAYVVGITALYDNTKGLIHRELERQGIEVTGGFMGSIHTRYGRIEVMSIHSTYFGRGATYPHTAMVIDDADMLHAVDFNRLDDKWKDMPMLITGTEKKHTMELFLYPELVANRNVYHEVTWRDMVNAGITTESEIKRYYEGFGHLFSKHFGPWALMSNKDNKHVLEKYDS